MMWGLVVTCCIDFGIASSTRCSTRCFNRLGNQLDTRLDIDCCFTVYGVDTWIIFFPACDIIFSPSIRIALPVNALLIDSSMLSMLSVLSLNAFTWHDSVSSCWWSFAMLFFLLLLRLICYYLFFFHQHNFPSSSSSFSASIRIRIALALVDVIVVALYENALVTIPCKRVLNSCRAWYYMYAVPLSRPLLSLRMLLLDAPLSTLLLLSICY